MIKPIYTLYSGYLWVISSFKGLLGWVKIVMVPFQGFSHHFPYDGVSCLATFLFSKRASEQVLEEKLIFYPVNRYQICLQQKLLLT